MSALSGVAFTPMIASDSSLPPSVTVDPEPPARRFLRTGLQLLCFVVVPVLLAGLYVRQLVPTPAEARGPFTVVLAQAYAAQPVLFAMGLFLLFSAVVRYWRSYLPGGGLLEAPVREPATGARDQNASPTRQIALAVGTAVLAGLTALLLRTLVLTPCRVLSASMLPTLTPGDLLATDRLAYGAMHKRAERALPSRGDIVVFRGSGTEETPQPLVKRVIGLPGDRIAMHGSRPIINGWQVPSCDAGLYLYVLPDGGAVKARLLVEFLDDEAYLTIAAPPPREFHEVYEVKPGEVFVLGDNRNNSSDSRALNEGRGGGLSLAQIDGRARWLLISTRRDQRADAGHFFESIGGTRLRLEALDVAALRDGIAKCLSERPPETRAPAPRGDASTAPLSPPVGTGTVKGE